ncbi:hypothetical protein KM043_007805 [Ampulex compressa]|nr:hypothetical protein KM043_007805 [Ampulex compressa]
MFQGPFAASTREKNREFNKPRDAATSCQRTFSIEMLFNHPSSVTRLPGGLRTFLTKQSKRFIGTWRLSRLSRRGMADQNARAFMRYDMRLLAEYVYF